MHGLRHKKLTGMQGARRGGSKQTGFNNDGFQSNRSKEDHAGTSKKGSADGTKSNRVNTRRVAALATSSERTSGGNSKTAAGDASLGGSNGVNSTMVAVDGDHSERTSANGINCERVANGVNSQLNSASEGGQRVANGVNSQLSSASEGGNSELNIGSKRSREDAPKRGRAKMSRTELKMAPRSGKVELEPRGDRPQVPLTTGSILKREYPGMIKVYDDHGTVVKHQPSLSWNDYYWKKNKNGVYYAKRVKQEFWSLFTVNLKHRAAAARILEAYLVKRVTNMVYQLRLDAVKVHFNKRKEECDDIRTRTIELTEEQYLASQVEWCKKATWAWFSKYWVSDEYKRKRLKAQESCMNSEDTAQNRGGSRNFSKTQQLLEHNFGPEKGGTLNTYAVMKSGYKTVDSTGRSGPIPSQKAQRCLDDYKELAADENSQDLDGKALYTMGGGMKHGRVPIGDGAVDKETVLVHQKSVPFKPINPDDYERVLKENEQLKQTNEILLDENSVNRALIMTMYADFGKEPPAELLSRLASIDARRHQTAGSSHGASHSVDDRRDESDDDDDNYHESSEDDDDDDDDDDEDDVYFKGNVDAYSDYMKGEFIVGKSWKEMLMMKKPSKAIHDKHCIDINCDIKSPTEASSS